MEKDATAVILDASTHVRAVSADESMMLGPAEQPAAETIGRREHSRVY
jgi:hypothetical protein